ncbi:MAG: serine/threonine-protein kinase [Egibacteraceae bacterium]
MRNPDRATDATSDHSDQTDTLTGTNPGVRHVDNRDALAVSAQPRILGRRYLLEERIASGGMASVWRAHDEVLARTVAVKVLHDHLSSDAAFRERFRREAVTAARLAHPNIVSLYDTGTDGDQVYLVMEFVDGPTLRDVITEVGALEIGQVAAIGERVARALDYAHSRGLVHRDVKPANILIGQDGTVKVADFGIAKADQDSDLTRTGMVLGTAAYVAPEQVLANPLDGKADQYSLGCVLYEAVTGRRPFKGHSPVATAAQRLERDPLPPRSIRADIPRGLEQIVGRCLTREKSGRFPSCGQLADALSAFAQAEDQETVGLLAAPPAPPAPPAPSKHPGAPPPRSLPQPRSVDSVEPRIPSSRRGTPPPRVPEHREESFFASEGRWLVPVLALLVLAGTLVGVGLATGVLETGSGLIPRFARDVTGLEAGAGTPVLIRDISDYDPLGDQGENGGELRRLTDGDRRTAWRTEGYDTPDLGGLKEGVGFFLDLGEVHPIASVQLLTTTPGVTYELRVADRPAATIGEWQTVSTVTGAPEGTNVVPFEGQRARYILVWVRDDLQRDGDRFYAGFSEVIVEEAPVR